MICAIVIADGVKQVMFTPESENEKMALKMIGINDEIMVERREGTFYNDFTGHDGRGYNVALCKGGYLRAFQDSDSLMLVLRDKQEKTEEPKESDYGLTPEQFKSGVSKLWKALGIDTVQDSDVFTIASDKIIELNDKVEKLSDELAEYQ